ncbi:MAG: LamG domain-containing protein [Lentisphaerae bacterium]|nr:LamG domain-containing protein [Lentisphaerota bacterium]
MQNFFRHLLLSVLTAAFALPLSASTWETDLPWQKEYKPDDSTIALWQFNMGEELQDSSGNGCHLAIRGSAAPTPDGKFGVGLLCRHHEGDQLKPSSALAADADILSPDGAFTVELWAKPSSDLFKQPQAFLVDKKYFHYASDRKDANSDYGFYLQQNSRQPDQYQLVATLGFGTDSVWASSSYLPFEADTWYHLAFTYDGNGKVAFFRDGELLLEKTFPGRKAIANGGNGVAIGDRFGSNFNPFPGVLDEVRISRGVVAFQTGKVTLNFTPERTVFYRLEPNQAIRLNIHNGTTKPVTQIIGTATVDTFSQNLSLHTVQPGQRALLPLMIDTSLRPGAYVAKVNLTCLWEGETRSLETEVPFDIVARPSPAMPVIMWGHGDLERLNDIGFTHSLRYFGLYKDIWDAKQPINLGNNASVISEKRLINDMMRAGVDLIISVSPGRWFAKQLDDFPEFRRLDRNGNPLAVENAAVAHPDIQKFAYNTGASIRQTYGHFPNFTSALVQTEVRDSTQVSFTPFEVKAAEEFLGGKIPDAVASKNGVHYSSLPNFPLSRVIPDNDPILKFYTWFWKDGDGWNPLHTQVHRGLKSQLNSAAGSAKTKPSTPKSFWTFFDPAVRAPSLWGSGGHVDVINQWTYSYPDPIKIGQAADEMFAMAEGNRSQQVMKMTQIIWYRSATAPNLPEKEEDRVQWEKDIPDAKFITISPTHLSEALWSKISRPVRGIMYHGWGSLFPSTHGSYCCTNHETALMLKKLVHEVVQPLGPMLLAIPDRKADIAILESFSSQMFAGRGTTGWSRSWEADMHLILQWAGLQPAIVYDETIRRDRLKDYKILVMPYCDVLTESVAKAITAFQKRGGIVVADEFLCPAILPDILVQSYSRTNTPHEDKAALQKIAADLSAQLEPFYERAVFSSNQDIVPRLRRYGKTDYLFTINDYRTYGAYLGHHRLVMEQGLPTRATVTMPRSGYVYDLVQHKLVTSAPKGEPVILEQDYAAGEGKLHMITDVPLEKIVALVKPETPSRGGKAHIFAWVCNDKNTPPNAITPIAVDIIDPEGRKAEFSGYYAAVKGSLQITFNFAPNDIPGKWTVNARCLASGNTAKKTFVLE